MRAILAFSLVVAACSETGVTNPDTGPGAPIDAGNNAVPPVDSGPVRVDADGDGFSVSEGDCNDDDRAINPDAEEVCDGEDNNCNQETDEGVMPTWYLDSDGDTYGSPSLAVAVEACVRPAGFVDNGDDCRDDAPMINPAAQELCDGINNDCDDETDEDTGTNSCRGCMDENAPNYDEDATVPCEDCCDQPPQPCDGTSGRQVEICVRDVDNQTGHFNVYMVNTVAVGGFQFDLAGASFSSVCCGSSQEQAFTVQHTTSRLLGFSMSGAKISPSQGANLVRVGFSPSDADPCLVDVVMASQFGANLSVSVHCQD